MKPRKKISSETGAATTISTPAATVPSAAVAEPEVPRDVLLVRVDEAE